VSRTNAVFSLLLCLATVLVAWHASATPLEQPKTRVWDFAVASALSIRPDAGASPRPHLEKSPARYDGALGSPQAAEAGAELAGGAGRTFEILEGVRRSKAAELAGKTSITAEVQVGGRVTETLEVPLESLRSPFKSAIDVSSSPAQMQRFQSILDGTRAGDPLPPITVQPGGRGPSIFDVFFQ
jgi:hypothetical protein